MKYWQKVINIKKPTPDMYITGSISYKNPEIEVPIAKQKLDIVYNRAALSLLEFSDIIVSIPVLKNISNKEIPITSSTR